MAIQEAVPGRLGSYRLLDRIGEGGMGVVHLAADQANRLVAVKVLRTPDSWDKAARRRLEREVESMRRVRSQFVPEVIDADMSGDVPYLVTRFVPGRSLSQLVTESGPLSGAPLQRLAYGLADALAAAHAAGVIHRDLKPANVMMNGDDPLVIDFGIAATADQTPLTRTGIIIGTPGYLAPEIIEGQSCQPASDVHSWGATVGFAARGEPVYGTGSYEAVLSRIVRGDAQLDGIHSALYPLIAAALLHQPSQRPSAAWLASQVAQLDLTVPGQPPTLGPHPRAARVPAAPRVPPPRPALQQPADFAGLLPSVVYAPGVAQQRVRVPVRSGTAGRPVRPEYRCRRRRVLGILAVLAAATLSLKLPVAATAGIAALLIMLRTAGCARNKIAARRRWRGPKAADRLVLAAALPWVLARSVLVALLASPVLLILAGLPAVALILALGRAQLPLAVACSGSTYTVLNCAAPTAREARREWSRVVGAITPAWPARALAAVMLAAVAAAAVLITLASGPSFWPAPGLQPALRLARTYHVTVLTGMAPDSKGTNSVAARPDMCPMACTVRKTVPPAARCCRVDTGLPASRQLPGAGGRAR